MHAAVVLDGFQPVHAEELVWVSPARSRKEAGRDGKVANGVDAVLVGVLGVDRIAFGKHKAIAIYRDDLAKCVHMKIRMGLAIGPLQQVAIEVSGHARSIVVSRVQDDEAARMFYPT